MVLLRRFPLWILVMASIVLLASFATLALRALAHPAPSLRGQVVFPAGSRQAPDFTLQDQFGRRVSLHALRGRVLVITFLDSHCTQDCPIIGRELALIQRHLGPSVPWSLLIVSVAPLTDSPASSATFALKSGWHGDWRWLFGTPSQLAKVWAAYGIWVDPTTRTILHTAALYLVDTQGFVRVANMLPFLPAQLEQSIETLATSSGDNWWDRLREL